MSSLLPNGRQYYENSAGQPLVGGKLYTYDAGTTNPRLTYQDAAGTIPNTNPIILDARGECLAFWSGNYKVQLKDALDALIWTVDNYASSLPGSDLSSAGNGFGADLVGGVGRVVDTIAALKALAKTGVGKAFVLGYYARGDGGGGQYHYDSTDLVSVDNGGTVIVAADAGRWKLIHNGTVSVKQFGAKADGTDDAAYWIAAAATGLTVIVPKGGHKISTVTVGTTGCHFHLNKDAVVTVTAGGIKRSLLQTLRATFIGANPLLDDYNYYWTLKVTGHGTFMVNANATAISDRVPFLVYTGLAPIPAKLGITIQRPLYIAGDINIVLTDPTSIGIGVHGGWSTIVRDVIFTGYNSGTAVDIGGSSADGDTQCHPQEIVLDNVIFNSCKPFNTALNGCTNAAEDLTVKGCKFNFVYGGTLTGINVIRWVGGNQYVCMGDSMIVTDCVDVLFDDYYLESETDPTDPNNPGIVNFHNCPDLKLRNGSVYVLATAAAVARDGILIKTNAVSAMRGVIVDGLRGIHQARDAALETNLLRFATGGGAGQLLDVTVRDVVASDWHNAVNFTDHITTLATGVYLENIANSNGVKLVKGLARVAPTAIRAPGIWEQFSIALSANSIGGGIASTVGSDFLATVMRCAAPVVTVTNFANLANAAGIQALWASIGANSVHITMTQTAGSVAGALVQGTATITVDGSSV
jgi:hypothetical protein